MGWREVKVRSTLTVNKFGYFRGWCLNVESDGP
jgi:hypothetical protein